MTTPSTPPQSAHRKRGSIASPITPLLDPSHRTLSTSSTPQHTSPIPIPQVSVSADPLVHPQIFIGGILCTIVLSGIIYSIVYGTAIETSVTSLVPRRASYLARKENILNQLFVKKSWGWTSLAFLSHLVSSPPSKVSRKQRLLSFLLATAAWVAFSAWFFGPSLNHRLISLSGGTCAVSIPEEHISLSQLAYLSPRERPPVRWGQHLFLPVPDQYCYGAKSLTPEDHPGLFERLAQVGGDRTGTLEAGKPDLNSLSKLVGKARFHAGFDVSGHMFLLTLSSLILAKELAPSWRVLFGGAGPVTARGAAGVRGARGARGTGEGGRKSETKTAQPVPIDQATGSLGRGGSFNAYATIFGTGLIGLWAFMMGATAVYFHNPPEKLSGLLLGLTTAAVISLLTRAFTYTGTFFASTSSGMSRPAPSALLDSAFVGEDENSARRGSSKEISAGEEDKKTK